MKDGGKCWKIINELQKQNENKTVLRVERKHQRGHIITLVGKKIYVCMKGDCKQGIKAVFIPAIFTPEEHIKKKKK